MKISEVIKNLTEIQDPTWAADLSVEEIEYIESNFWLIWMKLKSISESAIIEPLLKISELLSLKEMKDGKLKIKRGKIEFRYFYDVCISLIPKKEYKYIYAKKKERKDFDYQFLSLIAKDLNESIESCEDYYEIYEEYGTLEKEKEKLYNRYGFIYKPVSLDIIQTVNINSINEHPKRTINKIKSTNKEYIALKESIKKFGLLEPIILEKKTNYIVCGYMKYQCCKELGIEKVQVITKVFNFDVLELINFKLDSSKLISEQLNNYQELRRKIMNLGYKKRKVLMKGLSMRDYLFKQTGISQTQVSRLAYIEKTDSEIHNKVLEGAISINQGYSELKKLKTTTK